jgi:hypothetical protein
MTFSCVLPAIRFCFEIEFHLGDVPSAAVPLGNQADVLELLKHPVREMLEQFLKQFPVALRSFGLNFISASRMLSCRAMILAFL